MLRLIGSIVGLPRRVADGWIFYHSFQNLKIRRGNIKINNSVKSGFLMSAG